MKYQILFPGKNKKKYLKMSAENFTRVLSVKIYLKTLNLPVQMIVASEIINIQINISSTFP